MNVNPRRPLFNRKPRTNIYRMFLWVVMILGGVWLLQQIDKGEIKPLFDPTPTPTRAPESYILEGDASFRVGKVDAAIIAYREALKVDPNNADIWAKLARIQTYSSAFLITDDEKKTRLLEALESATQAVELAPENSIAHAIRAFALDWNADDSFYTKEEAQDFLAQAEQEALTAQRLDSQHPLVLAYYAEILVDQARWNQAELVMKQALELPDAPQWMDVYRVNAYVYESMADYNLAIVEYEKAIAIEPNFTFLYRRIGANYRRLAFDVAVTQGEDAARPVYEQSLEYFDKAVKINAQIGVRDPGPHLSIASTYAQLGEFFIAARNVQTALEYEPTNPDIYGQLGVIYYRSRNYEGSIDSLKCVVYGCSGESSCLGRGLDKCYPDLGENPVDVRGLPISVSTIHYYYIYGSVLAGLSRPADNKCDESRQIMQEVRTELETNPDDYAEDTGIILGIVQEGEFICQSLTGNANLSPSSTLIPLTEVSTPEVGGGISDATVTPVPTLYLPPGFVTPTP